MSLNEQEKLDFFTELLGSAANLYLWDYDNTGFLIHTTADELILHKIFKNVRCKDYMIEHSKKYTAPLILSGPLGIMWSAVFNYQNDELINCYVLGPIFSSYLSDDKMSEYSQKFQLKQRVEKRILKIIRHLPVLSPVLFIQYTLMLHYCVTGEKLDRSAVHFQKKLSYNNIEKGKQQDHTNIWNAERTLLGMVRDGNLEYENFYHQIGMLSQGVNSNGKDPFMNALISCTSFVTLCTREAINAGLSPETAYPVGDQYIQSMLNCRNITELADINHEMLDDFIHRVYKHRLGPKTSPTIRDCIEYIEGHSEEELSLPIIANISGYSEYHLSRKFKEEVGTTLVNYIKCTRVEKSKYYLVNTDEPIAQIADRFQFCSSSHYSSSFLQVTGMKPQQYRQQYSALE